MFQHPTPLYNVACCEALLGNSKTALEFLQKAVTAGYSNATHMEADADLRSLREFPEFKALVASLKPSEPSSSSSTSSVQIPITTTAPTPSATNSTSNSAAIPNHVPTDPTPPPAPSPVFVPTPSVSAPTPAPASPTVTADLENEKMKHLESMGFVDRQKMWKFLREQTETSTSPLPCSCNRTNPQATGSTGGSKKKCEFCLES